jgi:ubiquinone/menaquinone biosynthesis C-methylase UbiE
MEQRSDITSDTDYSLVSEIPGIRVTREAASMLYTRYRFASSFCESKDVLELGCGAGIGLGHLARHARLLIGGDYSESMLRSARYSDRLPVPLVRLDAQGLPFKDSCFDVVLLFEAIYYLPRPKEFLRECRRILRDTGTILLCSANKEWAGFSPSALSHSYFSAFELRRLLAENQFDSEIYGAFQAFTKTRSGKLVNFIRAFAVKLDLIPQTMRGKEFLKQIFYGRLVTLGSDIPEDIDEHCVPEPIPPGEGKAFRYKVIYAVGRPQPKTPVEQPNLVGSIELAESQTQ